MDKPVWELIAVHETCMYSMGPNPNKFGYIFRSGKDGSERFLPCRDYDYTSIRPSLLMERQSLLTSEFREVFDSVLLENQTLRSRVQLLEEAQNYILAEWLTQGMRDATG